jgi:hypothetical protein
MMMSIVHLRERSLKFCIVSFSTFERDSFNIQYPYKIHAGDAFIEQCVTVTFVSERIFQARKEF